MDSWSNSTHIYCAPDSNFCMQALAFLQSVQFWWWMWWSSPAMFGDITTTMYNDRLSGLRL